MHSQVSATKRTKLLSGTCLSTTSARLAIAAALGAGTIWIGFPAHAVDVANDAQLRSAIANAQNGDTITFTANITLSANLPQLQRSVTINGNNFTLSGDNQYRALSIQAGTVAINDLTIANARAQGGNGGQGGNFGGGGGGGAGLGGALFVAQGAGATLANVTMQGNLARGGNGGDDSGSASGAFGGGGGGGYLGDGAPNTSGGQGGLGNGGNANGNSSNNAQPGGFGGGGGGNNTMGRDGGFGGGGGGIYATNQSGPGNGGFGAGNGGGGGRGNRSETTNGAGGGGAGLGGAIFVQQGGSLILNGGLTILQNSVAGGQAGPGGIGAAQNGQGIGSGLFLQGNGSLTVAPGAGQTQTISDAIVDQTGIAKSGGSWSLVKNGAGTTVLNGANAYTGGTAVNAGILEGNSAGLQGNIVNNASVVFNQSANGSYAGVMSGSGSLTKTGAGDLSLTGASSYGGGTTVTGGALLIASDASLGTAGTGIGLNGGAIGTANSQALTINRPISITNNGGIRVDGSGPLTWGGVISGSALAKSGGGELILSGANTYGGGTSVTGGVLRFTIDGNLGAAGTAITLNGGSVGSTTDTTAATTMSRAITLTGNGGVDVALHPLIWSGNISGAGQFIKSGNGELELTGTNTYGGGTLVRRGNLRIASDDKLGAAGTAITLQDNGGLRAATSFATSRPVALTGGGGTIQVDDTQTMTLNGVVSGTTLTKVDRGTLVLAGANTYTGNTNVFGGTVRGNASTIRGNIVFDPNTANPIARSVIFDQATSATFAGNITNRGSLIKTGLGTLTLTGTNTYTEGTTVAAGVLKGTSTSLQGAIVNDSALIFDQAFAGSYGGAMSGSGTLFKNGTGRLSLTGVNSVGGGTTISAGALAVNNQLTSNVTINQGGTLAGIGNVNGDVTNNGGTIEPGNSIGTLTIHGNLTWNSGTFDVEVSANGASDRIIVVGAGHRVTVNAGILQVIPEPGTYTPNTRYTILTAPAGGIATFQDIAGSVGFLVPTLSFDDANLYLSLVLPANAFRSAGQSANQVAVGAALDALAASGYVGGVVTAMANVNPAQGGAALQQLSGEPYADFGTVNIRSSQLFANTVGRQMAVERGAAVGAPKGVALAEACTATCEETAPPRFSAWLSGIGSTGSVLGDGNASGLTYTLGGTAFGIDYRLDPRFLLGIAGGWVGGSQWVNGFGGNGYTDSVSVALYGSFTQYASGYGFYADALAGYANSNNRLQRVIALPGQSAAVANGQTSANQFLGQIETGYRLALPFPANTSISPLGRLQIGSANQAGFTEYGSSPFNLSVAQQTTTSVRTTFGADLGASFDMGGGRPLDIGLRLGWMHEFADTARPITAAFAAAPVQQFTVLGATPQRDSAVIGLSAAAAITDRASLFASYDGEVGGGTDNHAIRVGFKMTW